MELHVYTWEGVLCDYELGRVSVVAWSLEQARQAAISGLTDSDDKHYVTVSQPNSVEKFIVPFCFYEAGSG